jgi:hypothetical protein
MYNIGAGTQPRIQSTVEIGFFSEIAHYDNLRVDSKESQNANMKGRPCLLNIFRGGWGV